MYKFSRKISNIFKAVLLTAVAIVFLAFGGFASKGALRGIFFCGQVLVPSLFPFMVISSFVVKSGLSKHMGRCFRAVTRYAFGLPEKCSVPIILGLIGGYPVGARGIFELYKKGDIDSKTAGCMAYFCVCAGPGFLVTFVGGSLLGSAEAGVCILSAQIISVIILGFVNKHIFVKKQNFNSNKEFKAIDKSVSEALVEATASGTYGALEMCGMVIAFSALLEIIREFISDFDELYCCVTVLLEVTSACNLLSLNKNVLMLAFAVGFGGLCVHFQIFQILKGIKINKVVFFLFRIMQGLITCGLTYFFIKIFHISIPVFSTISGNARLVLSSSMIGSSLLIITGLCFLYTLKNFKGNTA